MANTLSSVASGSFGGAAIVTTAGGPGGAPPVSIAAFQNADVLIIAVPNGLAAGGGVGASAQRPARPHASAGWAQPTIYTAIGSTKKSSQTGASSAAKKTTSEGSAATSKSTSTSTSTSTSKSSGPLAFLDDKNLTIEEKLYRFLRYVSDKNDKEIEKKLEEIKGKEKSAKSSSSGGKGLLGNVLGGVAKGLLGATGVGGLLNALGPLLSAAGLKEADVAKLLKQISGPLLAAGATALGFPQLAPLAMKAGPAVMDGAMSLLGNNAGGGPTGSSDEASSSSSSSSSKDFDVSKSDLLDLERLQDKQKMMFSLISNMLRAMHDTKMAVINNMRA